MIVLPMAGESRRFTCAGYDRPKFMLDLFGRPVFDYAITSFRKFFEREEIVLVLRETGGVEEFVRQRLTSLKLREAIIIRLAHKTAGQADTVSRGVASCGLPATEPLTIFNIDSFRPNYDIADLDASADGFLETFTASGTSWSFVVPSADSGPGGGTAVKVVEKERVSDECSNGLYRFSTAEVFREGYAREMSKPSQVIAEHYVAPIFNQVISMGGKVRFKHLPENATLFCGVPEEYEALRASPALPEKLLSSVNG